MISADLARALADAGVMWQPRAGDRFLISREGLTDDVFWVSDLTIEVHHYNDDTILGFNGTTEWALDSVPLELALWLPREDQLRDLLGEAFVGLRRGGDGWVVTLRPAGSESEPVEVAATDVEDAYAQALLLLVPARP